MATKSRRNSVFSFLPQFFKIEEKKLFLFFLLLSSFIWLLTSLDKYYPLIITTKILYKNIPQNLSVNIKSADTLVVKGFAKGFYHLQKKWNPKPEIIEINFDESINKRSFKFADLEAIVESQLPYFNVTALLPAVISLETEKRNSAIIPVYYPYNNKDDKSNKIFSFTFSPDSIKVLADDRVLDTLQGWPLMEIPYSVMEKKHKGYVNLEKPTHQNISLSLDSISYTIQQNELIEESIEVEIKLTNIPDNKKIIIYPTKALVTYQHTYSSDKAIEQANFEIVADFSRMDWSKESQLPLKVTRKPVGVENLRINPPIVDYIIYTN